MEALMKKFSVVFAFFCAIFLFAACNGGKDSESETAKLGGSCSVTGKEACSVKNSEILVCKDSLWHTKKICNINFGEYCRENTDGSFSCVNENGSGKPGNEEDVLPDSSQHPAEDSDTSDLTNDSDDLQPDNDSDTAQENEPETGETRDAECVGKPENADWNTVSSITQTWNGTEWSPSSTGSYSETESSSECRFKCKEHYTWNTADTACEPGTQLGNCSGNLPEHAVWNDNGANGKFTQTWSSSGWIPATYDATYSTTDGECKYTCDSTHYWYSSECVSPCDDEPCSEVANSTHDCIASSWDQYYCGCEEGHSWNGEKCILQLTLGNICTGQTKCYSNENEIICPSSASAVFFGQDAQYAAAGYCTPQTFTLKTLSGQKVVEDLNTALLWATDTVFHTFYEAASYCINLTYGGYSNWRLPTPQELLTIVDNSRYETATNAAYFPLPSSYFWSSADFANHARPYAWVLGAGDGSVSARERNSLNAILCVKNNALPAGGPFTTSTVNGDAMVTDSRTGLIWQKSYLSNKTWQEALSYCKNLTYGGYSDWRLPNKNELASLVNYERYNPASDFPDMPAKYFWSSSTLSDHTSEYAWLVEFEYGVVIPVEFKTSSSGSIRCLR